MEIDLNADLGESFGPYSIGDDAAMLEIVSSANVACGFHGGDPVVMESTVNECIRRDVAIGAHPGFADREGFGRRRIHGHSPAELTAMLRYQIGALQGVTAALGGDVTHVKLHGALANMASEDDELAGVCIGAMRSMGADLYVMAMASTALERAAQAAGAPMAREIYADRSYNDDGTLVSRGLPGAVIHDAQEAADRVVRMLETGSLETVSGASVAVVPESVCVHGDHPESVVMARTVREAIEAAGHTVRAFATVP